MNPADPKPDSEVTASDAPRLIPEPEPSPIAPPLVVGPAPAPVVPAAAEPVAKDNQKKEKGKDREKDKEKGKEDKEKEREKEKGKDKDKDRKKKEFKRADPWQRYKAQLDALKEAQDLVDLADHKARFALIIMGALNAAIIILGTRSDALTSLPPNLKLWLYAYFLVYASIAIYFLVQAIESLRPRSLPDLAPKGMVSEKAESLGIRFFLDALRYDRAMYMKAWQTVRVSHLNAEIASQLYNVARINKAKYNAVAKLYLGLQAITVLTAGLLIALGVAAWTEHRISTDPQAVTALQKSKGGKAKKAAKVDLLGAPQHFPISAVREPSGVVYFPSNSSLYVIGDEGSLARVDLQGNVVASFPVKGNLEDVAFHPPSGKLIILNEKKGELLVTDAQTGTVTGRFMLDAASLLGPAAGGKNEGFEGLAFRPVPGEPGGGIFYLVHQKEPAALLAIAFDPTAPGGIIGSAAKRGLREMPGRDDLTAVTVMPDRERLAVIAHHRILIMSLEGDEEFDFSIPGSHQEGIAFDAGGDLWIAQDRSPEPQPNPIDQPGLLRFKGALAIIEKELASRNPEDSTSSGKS